MLKNATHHLGLGLFTLALSGASIAGPKPAEPATVFANETIMYQLPFADKQAFEDARRGFVAALPDGFIVADNGDTAWNMGAYDFLEEEQAPPTVNPSLWRQARLNSIHGLFEVVEGMYQIRGMDLSNMTIVEGDTGLIIIDPLLTPATAKAGLELYYQQRPKKPVRAVLYTHSHVDHFGGVKGVVDESDVRAGKVKIYAPVGFMEHAVSENVIAGNAMIRRTMYQFGSSLPLGERGHVDTGLGKALSKGPLTLIPPTDTVPDNASLSIDGIDIEFIMAHGTEADSEMMMYFPKFKVLNTAEITSQHLHNIYTIRGTSSRDASAWSHYIDKVLADYGDRTDILIAQHHWPIWNRESITKFLSVQRDLYKFIHDQVVRMMNKGMLPGDIAENLKLPESIDKQWHARGYYGTVKHNARGIYQRYMGWYDANPANLDPLPPRENGAQIIAYMGGIDKVVERARADFAKGNYRWVAWIMSQAVFAVPDNQAARELGADALEQLGYQAEAGTWRGAYLVGAQELRNGVGQAVMRPDLLPALETSMFFDLMAVRLNPEKAKGKHLVINWSLTDLDENYRLNLENSTLTHRSDTLTEDALADVSMTRATLDQILMQKTNFSEAVENGSIQVEGSLQAFLSLLDMLEEPPTDFPIIEPVQ